VHAIEVEHLGKMYRLGEISATNLREAITQRFQRRPRVTDAGQRDLWSLRDVTFSVDEGEAVGVIGRNGAGKSTLLKILSRITEPTTGVARTRGRVGALLEVGTGFHPELTGRENVFLNGVILGMSRRDVEQRFDAIAEFSGVERFLDTPIKRYSSGMKLRLAFAVAAHLDPAIMVVDEVLAVGDVEFQRKCIGKMHDVEKEGRTVVFVSHDMEAINRLCSRVLWIERGEVRLEGPTRPTIDAYLAATSNAMAHALAEGLGSGPLRLHDLRIVAESGARVDVMQRDRRFAVEIEYELSEAVPALDIALVLTNERGVRVLDEALSEGTPTWSGDAGRYIARLDIPPILNAGDYEVGCWFGTAYEEFLWEPSLRQLRLEGGVPGRLERAVVLDLPWQIRPANAPLHLERDNRAV
jgi:ABC-type polysaccharide/polyol phosphate transport system ATPase subunit